MPHRPAHIAAVALLAAGCGARTAPDDTTGWWDAGADLTVQEPVVFTDQPYDFPVDPDQGIGRLRTDLLTQDFDNDGPLFAPGDFPGGTECPFWESSDELPRRVTGIVTSNPRIYEKLDGCGGSEKFYSSYWLQDGTGGIFVLGVGKVAAFSIGDRVTIEVRSVRRRYGVDMVYVHDLTDVEPGPFPIAYETRTGPLGPADQSRVVRARGVVVSAADGFGEALVQIDGAPGACTHDDSAGRAACLPVFLDTDLSRRGLDLQAGAHVEVTGPVAQTAYFAPDAVYSFYGVHISRLGQLTRLDESDGDR